MVFSVLSFVNPVEHNAYHLVTMSRYLPQLGLKHGQLLKLLQNLVQYRDLAAHVFASLVPRIYDHFVVFRLDGPHFDAFRQRKDGDIARAGYQPMVKKPDRPLQKNRGGRAPSIEQKTA